MKLLYFQW